MNQSQPYTSTTTATVDTTSTTPSTGGVTVVLKPSDFLLLGGIGLTAYGAWKIQRWNEKRLERKAAAKKIREEQRAKRLRELEDIAFFGSITLGVGVVGWTFFKVAGAIKRLRSPTPTTNITIVEQ